MIYSYGNHYLVTRKIEPEGIFCRLWDGQIVILQPGYSLFHVVDPDLIQISLRLAGLENIAPHLR